MNIDIDILKKLFNEYGDDMYECEVVGASSLNPVDRKTKELLQNQLKNNSSYKNTVNVAKLMNKMPGAAFSIPQTMKALKKNSAIPDYEYHIICDCENLVKDGELCKTCNKTAKKNSKKNNFIVSIRVIPQLKSILSANYDQIMSYLEREKCEGVITDIDDCEAFKKIATDHPNGKILALTLNIDGAAIFRSSKNSLWLSQLYLHFLPPEIRFRSENILVVTLYFGAKKPDPYHLISLLAMELDSTEISIFDGNRFMNFVPAVVTASCDLPAKAMLQNFKGPVGKYACAFCYHPGEAVKNLKGRTTIRYIKKDKLKLRTHDETVRFGSQIGLGENDVDSIDGVKGLSSMLLFNSFDIVNNFAIDIMHGIGLGIVKDVLQIWMGIRKIPDPNNNLKIKLKNEYERKCFNKRIIQLKPLIYFKRKPRTIFELPNYKATELLNFLLFYFRFAVVGLLPTKIVKHLELLSAASFILLKSSINDSELNQATSMLSQFSDMFEEIYGAGSITMNIHLLRHYGEMIRCCGPIWCNSLFGFESNIGTIKKLVSGTTDVLVQITEKYTTAKNLKENHGDIDDDKKCHENLLQVKLIKITERYKTVLMKHGIDLSDTEHFRIAQRLKLNGATITSMLSAQTKSADFFIEMNDGSLGTAEFFFYLDEICLVFLNLYEVTYVHYHLSEVVNLNKSTIFPCSQIKRKVLYLKCNNIEYISETSLLNFQ